VILALLCVACASLGVFLAYRSAVYAEIGEVPDLGGSSFLGSAPNSYFELAKRYYIELRSHFRRSANEVGNFANSLLLVSVVAGLGINFVGVPWAIRALIVLCVTTLAIVLRLFQVHQTASAKRTAAIAICKSSITASFPNDAVLPDPHEFAHQLRRH